MIDNVQDVRAQDSYQEKAALIADMRDVAEPRAQNMERVGRTLDILDRVAPEVSPVQYLLD